MGSQRFLGDEGGLFCARNLLANMGFPEGLDTPVYEDNTACIEWGNHVIGGRERAVATCILYCTQPTPR